MAETDDKTDPAPAGPAKRIKSASDLLKSVGVLFAFAWAAVTFIAVLFWEARGLPWLTEQVKAELEKEEHQDWMRHRVMLVLTADKETEATKLSTDYKETPIYHEFTRPVSVDEMRKLFELEEFQQLFKTEVLLSVSARDKIYVDDLLADDIEGREKNLLEAWLNPPSVSALAGTVTEQVDALYTYKLFFKHQPKWENKRPVLDAQGAQVFETTSQVSERFYANQDQRITIEIDPNTSGVFGQAFATGASQIYLDIGTHRMPVPFSGVVQEVTCIVREQLRGRPAGFVLIKATTDTGEIPEGGYELDVIVTARKGGKSCA